MLRLLSITRLASTTLCHSIKAFTAQLSTLHPSVEPNKIKMASSLSKDDQIQNLRKLFADSDVPNDPKAWDKAWVDSTTPWDANKAQPALVELLRGAHDADTQIPDADGNSIPISQAIPKGDGTAVVPGCGRGYDAKVFAERGMTTYGVDISSAAVAAANKVRPNSLTLRSRFAVD